MPRRRAATIVSCVALLGLGACSSSHSHAGSGSTTSTSAAATTTTEPRPPGPAAMLKELTGGQGVFMGEAAAPDLQSIGYTQREYAAAGTATEYKAVGALTHDGRWKFVPDATAPYRTPRPRPRAADPKAFSGTVVVEWLNVSGGVDADPEWTSLQEEIARAGDAWVGVSAQRIGVEGGPVLVKVQGVPGAEAGEGSRGDRPGPLRHRSSIRATATRSTSSPRSPARSAPAPG